MNQKIAKDPDKSGKRVDFWASILSMAMIIVVIIIRLYRRLS